MVTRLPYYIYSVGMLKVKLLLKLIQRNKAIQSQEFFKYLEEYTPLNIGIKTQFYVIIAQPLRKDSDPGHVHRTQSRTPQIANKLKPEPVAKSITPNKSNPITPRKRVKYLI